MLETLYFQQCTLNVNKIATVVDFSETVHQFLLICFKVCMHKISDKIDKFLSNHSNLFWGPLFIRTQCTTTVLLVQICQGITQNDCRTKDHRRTGFKQDMYTMDSINGTTGQYIIKLIASRQCVKTCQEMLIWNCQ